MSLFSLVTVTIWHIAKFLCKVLRTRCDIYFICDILHKCKTTRSLLYFFTFFLHLRIAYPLFAFARRMSLRAHLWPDCYFCCVPTFATHFFNNSYNNRFYCYWVVWMHCFLFQDFCFALPCGLPAPEGGAVAFGTVLGPVVLKLVAFQRAWRPRA